jgi:hypothetical protein
MDLQVATWNFHERVDKRSKKGVISRWIIKEHLCKATQAKLDRALDQLKWLPKSYWSKPNPASSIGNNTFVIRFSDINRSQLRVFGHFFDQHECFVMTANGYEKDNVYYPTDYQDVAKTFKEQCDQDFSESTTKFGTLCEVCKSE